MADDFKISLFGIEELDKFFEGMQRTDQKRLIIGAYRIGTKPLIKTARQMLRAKIKTKGQRHLEKSIGFVPGRNRGKTFFVSAKVGARKFGQHRGYHGHLYDAGTTSRRTKGGHNRGAMPASHFFTNALKQTEEEIIRNSQDDMLKSLEKVISRKMKKITV